MFHTYIIQIFYLTFFAFSAGSTRSLTTVPGATTSRSTPRTCRTSQILVLTITWPIFSSCDCKNSRNGTRLEFVKNATGY